MGDCLVNVARLMTDQALERASTLLYKVTFCYTPYINMHKMIKISCILGLLLMVLITGFSVYSAVASSKLENQMILPPFSYIDLAPQYEYITVDGTLVSTMGGGIGSPLNTVEFTCDKSAGQCNLVQAELLNSKYLTTSTESFPIKSWDENFVVFSTVPLDAHCVVWTYRIDRVKHELIGVREQSDRYNSQTCLGIGAEKFGVEVVDGVRALKVMRER